MEKIYQYLITCKGCLFVPVIISCQSPIVNVKISCIDWLEMSPKQMSAPCSQRDISPSLIRNEDNIGRNLRYKFSNTKKRWLLYICTQSSTNSVFQITFIGKKINKKPQIFFLKL